MRARRRPRVVGAVASCLLLAGCGSTSTPHASSAGPDGITPSTSGLPTVPATISPLPLGSGAPLPTTGSSTPPLPGGSAAPTLAPPAPGADTSDILIGLYGAGDTTGAGQGAGYKYSQSVTAIGSLKAAVAAWNKLGGLAGRHIKTVVVQFDPNGSDYSTQHTAACASFTQDHHVALVISLTNFSPELDDCLNKAHVPRIDGVFASPDDRSYASHPGYASVSAYSINARTTAMLRVLTGTGELKPTSKLGLIIESCPTFQNAYKDSVAPVIKQLGLHLASTLTVDCVTGVSAGAGTAAQIQSGVLRFQQSQVDRVFFMSSYETVGLLMFMNTAESQAYRPDYVVTSLAAPTAALKGSVPDQQFAHIHGVGWLPSFDVTTSPSTPAAANRGACLRLMASQGVVPHSQLDYYYALAACDPFVVVDSLLRSTAGSSSFSALVNAIGRGVAYTSAVGLPGQSQLDSSHHTGPRFVRPFGWSSGCSCLVYVGAAQRA